MAVVGEAVGVVAGAGGRRRVVAGGWWPPGEMGTADAVGVDAGVGP